MSLWLAGSIAEILETAPLGLTDTLVTNPTVMADWTREARAPLAEVALRVVRETGLRLYVQLRGPDRDAFLREAEALRALSPLILPKLPSTLPGLAACRQLADQGIPVLVTTVCSLSQAWLAAAAGADSICPYFARLQETGSDPAALLRDTRALYDRMGVPTRILPASIRSPQQAESALAAGASGLIVFAPLFRALCGHPVTESSLRGFEDDWRRTLGAPSNPQPGSPA